MELSICYVDDMENGMGRWEVRGPIKSHTLVTATTRTLLTSWPFQLGATTKIITAPKEVEP